LEAEQVKPHHGKAHYLKDEKAGVKEEKQFNHQGEEEMKLEHKPVIVSWDGIRWNPPQSIENLAVPKYVTEKPKKVRVSD
jgi:hypothetical protein